MSVKEIFRVGNAARAWLIFVLLAAAVVAISTLLQLNRPSDGLKSFAWFVLFGGAAILLDHKFFLNKRRIAWSVFCVVFIVDLAVQGVVRQFFGATPSPAIVAQAIQNTNPNEAKNFILEQLSAISWSLVFLVLSFALVYVFNKKYLQSVSEVLSRIKPRVLMLLGAAVVALHFNPTMLRQQPFLRWGVVLVRNIEAQKEVAQAKAMRSAIEQTAANWNVVSEESDKTVVLVIGESSNRNNWGHYGYPRATTLPLENTLKNLSGETIWFTQAKSSAAFTLPSLEKAFTPANIDHPDDWKKYPDVFMLAKQAGYNITWLSNQPGTEGWISTLGNSADEHAFINNGNWRDSSSTDMELLPKLKSHLDKPAPKKELIVLHVLGQHFHYQLRCPVGVAPYSGIDDDEVMSAMKAAGRSSGIRGTRNDYDNSVYCGAMFLSEVLNQVNEMRPQRNISLVYFSDHGQEVGHTEDFAGHSESSEQGYTIPLFVWQNQPAGHMGREAFYKEPFSLDNFEQLLQHTLGIRSEWYDKNLDPTQSTSYPKITP